MDTLREIKEECNKEYMFYKIFITSWQLGLDQLENRFMKNQRDLNFIPGDQYVYCNTGYMLMVNIIEKITGEKFPKWMKETIFEPLGMTNTYVEDNYDRIVSNNATSYYKSQSDDFSRAVEFWGYIGSGNAENGRQTMPGGTAENQPAFKSPHSERLYDRRRNSLSS